MLTTHLYIIHEYILVQNAVWNMGKMKFLVIIPAFAENP